MLEVEDEDQVKNLAAQALREQGYIVLEASSRIEALRVAEESPHTKIQLLLTDVVMPLMAEKSYQSNLAPSSRRFVRYSCRGTWPMPSSAARSNTEAQQSWRNRSFLTNRSNKFEKYWMNKPQDKISNIRLRECWRLRT